MSTGTFNQEPDASQGTRSGRGQAPPGPETPAGWGT